MPVTTVSHFRILDELGRGGMGVVYRALDTRLDREVALKFLPENSVPAATTLERFRREARAASALNHPGICTVYDIGEADGRSFIAMELLEGETLQQRIARQSLAPEALLDIAIQVADALDAAHAKGIVHRDLKPSNIFITARSQAKILDFGLAVRQRDAAGSAVAVAAPGGTETQLTIGGAVGTVAYMSPEQARGQDVDARTDLFSFGAVLYEMATGRAAFDGQSPAVVFDAVLNHEPIAMSDINRSAAPELAAIVTKALEKDRDLRYQSAAELRADLKRLKRQLESGSSAMPLKLPRSRRSRALPFLAAGFVLLALAAVAVYFYLRGARSVAPAAAGTWTQVTDFADSAVSPALSPDGRMLTFVRGASTFFGAGQIYVKLLPDAEPVQLTHDDQLKMDPVFSPDGSLVAYTVPFNTWIVPALGSGQPQQFLANASGLHWIDKDQLLFSEIKSGLHMGLVTAGPSRAGERAIYLPAHERGMLHRSYLSPDGKWVLAVEMDNAGLLPCRLLPFDGSSPGRQVGPPGPCTSAAWSPDGHWMYFNARPKGRNYHIWRQHFPEGTPEPITSGATDEQGLAISPDGRWLLTSVGLEERTIWLHDPKGDRAVATQGLSDIASFSGDGRKLFFMRMNRVVTSAPETGAFSGELWSVDLASGHSEPALPGVEMESYAVSYDAKTVAYVLWDDKGKKQIWVASLDRRSPPQQLKFDGSVDSPFFGPHGELFFRADQGNNNYIYCQQPDRTRKKVMSVPYLAALSPDARWIVSVATGRNGDPAEAAFPVSGGPPVFLGSVGISTQGWSGDGKWMYFAMVSKDRSETIAVPVSPVTLLPKNLPAGGISLADIRKLRGAKVFDELVIPGPNLSIYAYLKSSVHRNIFRIPLP